MSHHLSASKNCPVLKCYYLILVYWGFQVNVVLYSDDTRNTDHKFLRIHYEVSYSYLAITERTHLLAALHCNSFIVYFPERV